MAHWAQRHVGRCLKNGASIPMIRMQSIQQGHRLEVTVNRNDRDGEQALEIIMNSLRHSRYESHQAIYRQIEAQVQAAMVPIVRFALTPSAAARIEGSLRFVFRKHRLYPTRTHCDLHEALCRVLDLRLSTVQT